MFEKAQQSEAEILKAKLSGLKARVEELKKLIEESGERVDVDPGTPEGLEQFVDFGYTDELRKIEPQIEVIEGQLKDIDDQAAAQRNLAL